MTACSDPQADGQACLGCGKPGTAEDGVPVGTGDTGATVWTCHGGCTVIAALFGGVR